MSAIAGIDQALWDIKGKALGVPVHRAARRPGARPHEGLLLDRRRPAGRDRGRMARDCGRTRLRRGQDERHRGDAVRRLARQGRRGASQRVASRPRGDGPALRHRRRLPRPRAPADGEGRSRRSSSRQADVHRGAGAVRARRGAARDRATTARPRSRSASGCTRAGTSSRSSPTATSTSSSPIPRTRAASPRPARSPRWPRRTTSRSPCTARSARSRSPPTCSSTPSCYNAFIQEQSLGIHYNTANDLLDYLKDPIRVRVRRGHTSPSRAARASASRWTRRSCERMAQHGPSLAQPGLAPRRRQLRRVVTAFFTPV